MIMAFNSEEELNDAVADLKSANERLAKFQEATEDLFKNSLSETDLAIAEGWFARWRARNRVGWFYPRGTIATDKSSTATAGDPDTVKAA